MQKKMQKLFQNNEDYEIDLNYFKCPYCENHDWDEFRRTKSKIIEENGEYFEKLTLFCLECGAFINLYGKISE